MDPDRILVERAYQDFEDGLQQVFRLTRERHGRFAAASLEAVIHSALAAMDLRARMRDEVRELIALARRQAAGEDARALAAEHLPVLLKRKKIHLLIREDEPAYRQVYDATLELFAARLPDLARMATVVESKDYDDLVRRAFPDKAHVVAFVQENRVAVLRIIQMFEASPRILRAPASLMPRIAATAREMAEWKTQSVLQGVEEIYAAADAPA